MSLLAALNPPQREAAKYLDGPLLVLAGAGSGKTRVITHKIAYLIGECGYKPSSIAAITFTNKAAREMQDRAAKLTKDVNTKGLIVTTFHSMGLRMLREDAKFERSSIAAITFTNKAAREMQDRAAKLTKDVNTKGLIVTTFHSMGLRMLREDAKFAELKPAFSILDSADAARHRFGNPQDHRQAGNSPRGIAHLAVEERAEVARHCTCKPPRTTTRAPTPRSTTATTPPCAPTRRSISTT